MLPLNGVNRMRILRESQPWLRKTLSLSLAHELSIHPQKGNASRLMLLSKLIRTCMRNNWKRDFRLNFSFAFLSLLHQNLFHHHRLPFLCLYPILGSLPPLLIITYLPPSGNWIAWWLWHWWEEEERSSAVLSESSLFRSFASPSSMRSEDWRRFINLSTVARECIISVSSSCREGAFCVRCEMFTENINCAIMWLPHSLARRFLARRFLHLEPVSAPQRLP